MRMAAWKLYRWCRHCDDVIDSAMTREEALTRLHVLREKTRLAVAGSANLADSDLASQNFRESPLEPEFSGLREVCSEYKIPALYPLDLIRGFEMDVTGVNYESLQDVEVYAYHVAGVVGLMMTHIFGVKDPKAHRHAIDLGVAMQLTNIARDVEEDFGLQRVYLPHHWLAEENVPRDGLLHDDHHSSVQAVRARLLRRAGELYGSGYRGLQYLPVRAALAVSIAGSIYSFIGFKIIRRQKNLSRVYVTLFEKFFLAIVGSLRVVPLALSRTMNFRRFHELSQ